MRRFATGLGALILSAALLVGLPAALIYLAGNPIPSWDRVVQAFTMPDYGGEFLIGTVIPLIAWAAWLTFAIGYLAEIPNQLRVAAGAARGVRVRVPGLGMQQKAAGVLIAAIIAIFAPAGAMAATAAEAPAIAPVSVSASVAAPVLADRIETTTPAVAETAEETAATLYTVQPGDSLWAIAETALGDGNRYTEIIDLNHDRQQPGGYAVGQRDGIDPGMVLELPAGAAAPAAAASVDQVVEHAVTVEGGDTLWAIAADELGSGDRYPEIFEASQDIVQPDGRQLSDPNLIIPGWTVVVPGVDAAAPVEVAPAPVEEETAPPVDDAAAGAVDEGAVDEGAVDEGAAGTAVDEGTAVDDVDEGAAGEEATEAGGSAGLGFVTGGDAAPAEDTEPNAAPPEAVDDSADVVDDGQEWVDIVTDWRTLGGVGAVLAAGLLTFLGLRRRQQRRSRKPGQRIAMPAEDISAVELELRAVENPQGMDAVDQSLRMLAAWAQDTGATLPALYALRLSEDEISIYLDEPAQLPEPFVATTEDLMAWSIMFDQITPLERIPSPPYPALVTLGHDEHDAHVLVDLERVGALNVSGADKTIEAAALTALALELATSNWAENLQVTLVGIAPGLPDSIGSGRVRHVDDISTLMRNLRGQAISVTETLTEAGLTSLEQARTDGPFAESWTPEIIVLGQIPDEATRAELAELVTRVPRVGIAAIAAGHLTGGWNFRVTDKDTAELEIPGMDGASLPLVPQVVTQTDYDRILSLFTVATDENATDHSPASAELELDEIAETPQTEAPEIESPAAGLVDPPQIDDVDASDSELPTEHLVEPSPVDQVLESAPADDVDDERDLAPIVDLRTPRLQLMGPVTVLHPQGAAPSNEKQWNSQRLRAIELVAYIATHPDASTDMVHEALWPGNDPGRGTQSRNRLTVAARRWLGQDAEGRHYLVPATKGIYNLTDTFSSDWDEWQALVGDDPTAASTENLVRALNMVKGQPISGVKDKYYVWSETLRQEMIAAIGDAAHELATRALREGNTRNARMAAAIGRMVDPVNEVYWRDGMRAEHLAGDAAGVERLITQLATALTQIDPDYAEPEPETESLIDQLRARRALAG
ncbi:LysM peptidoglycan-binding domain-containing protein [Microbacterium maritypicum]|uniref:LysM peptidoglycan-binding domain-containing protein n=1 Tax=Microbacterium maritypicum TaxID=33918 RepID=UPI003A93D253